MCQHILVDEDKFESVDIIIVSRMLPLFNLQLVCRRLLFYSMNAGMQNEAGVVWDFYPIVGMHGVFNYCPDSFVDTDRTTVRRSVRVYR
jgi:hypothetical protein